MGTKVGGNPTGKMRWPTPQQKTTVHGHPQPNIGGAKSIASGSNKDHLGGLPKGKLRKG